MKITALIIVTGAFLFFSGFAVLNAADSLLTDPLMLNQHQLEALDKRLQEIPDKNKGTFRSLAIDVADALSNSRDSLQQNLSAWRNFVMQEIENRPEDRSNPPLGKYLGQINLLINTPAYKNANNPDRKIFQERVAKEIRTIADLAYHAPPPKPIPEPKPVPPQKPVPELFKSFMLNQEQLRALSNKVKGMSGSDKRDIQDLTRALYEALLYSRDYLPDRLAKLKQFVKSKVGAPYATYLNNIDLLMSQTGDAYKNRENPYNKIFSERIWKEVDQIDDVVNLKPVR